MSKFIEINGHLINPESVTTVTHVMQIPTKIGNEYRYGFKINVNGGMIIEILGNKFCYEKIYYGEAHINERKKEREEEIQDNGYVESLRKEFIKKLGAEII